MGDAPGRPSSIIAPLLRALASFIVVTTALWLERPAFAAEGLAIHLDCWALDAGARDTLEARARADLAVRGVSDGVLDVTCGPRDITLTFRDAHRRSTRSLPLEMPSSVPVESVLAALDDLVSEPLLPPPLPPPQPAPPPPLPLPVPPAALPRRASRTLGLRVAVRGEAWSTSVFAIGPRAEAFLGIGRIDVIAGAGTSFAGGSLGGMSAELTDVDLGAELGLGPKEVLRLGAGGFAGFLHVRAPSTVSPGTEDSATPGVWVRARAAFPLGPLVLSLGPDLRWYLRPKTVNVDGVKVFTLPAVALGAMVGAEIRF